MSLSLVDSSSESDDGPSPTPIATYSSSTSGYRRGTRMALFSPDRSTQLDSLPISSRQLESQVAESSSKQAYKIFGMKVAEYDEEEDVLKVLGVVWSEKEEDSIRRTGIKKEDINRMRTPSCVEWGWSMLNFTSLFLVFGSLNILALRYSVIYKIYHVPFVVCLFPLVLCLALLAAMIQKRCLGMPFRLIGRLGRIVCDGIALVAAFVLREAFPYDGSEASIYALLLLVNLTLYLHSWLKVTRHADDISICHVMLEMIVQALIYISKGHNIMYSFIVFFFCGIMCYKFVSYSIPITLEDRKKDLDS